MAKASKKKKKKSVRAPAQPVRLHDAAARSRANQRRRQKFSRHMRRFESLPGGWGITLDDVAAGIYAHIALRTTLAVTGW